ARSGRSNYYDLLGIKKDATMEEIKQAFFAKSKKLHPDSDPSNPDLHSQFIQLNEAYRVLSKEGSRRLYDSQRAWHTAWPTAGSSPKHSPFDFTDLGPSAPLSPSSRGPDENMRYWEQFRTHRAETFSGTQAKQRQRWNRQFFGYCLLLMLLSVAVHYMAYRYLFPDPSEGRLIPYTIQCPPPEQSHCLQSIPPQEEGLPGPQDSGLSSSLLHPWKRLLFRLACPHY
uniref:DnaJ heat shock protein family (Hsp40) member C4 n=1 Tax=Chelydra serpentina TaxID=8475 RepID=A0A8C3S137_CHESE